MNIPNQLTVSRFFIAVLVMICLTNNLSYSSYIAFILFIIASLTDALDGLLARKIYGCTNFGKLMDPLADKVLLTVVFIGLIKSNHIESWMVMLILSREFMVTGLRSFLSKKEVILSADIWGKLKTIIQMIGALFYLAALAWPTCSFLPLPYSRFNYILGLLIVFITLLSGIIYFIKYKDHIFKES